MSFAYTPYILPLMATAIIALITGGYTWKRRSASGASGLSVMSFSIFIWVIGYALEMSGATPEAKYWGVLQYLGIPFATYGCLIFALDFSDQTRFLSRRWKALLAIIPALTALLALTTKYHGWIWSEYHIQQADGFSFLSVTHGPWFFVHFAYSYLSLLVGTILIVRAMLRRKGMYRGQAIVMSVAVLTPWVGNILYFSGLSPVPYLDITPFALMITTLAFTWAMFGFRIIDLTPIARDLIIEAMQDGMIVLDFKGNVVDINLSAARMIGVPVADALGKDAAHLFAPWPHLIERFRNVLEASEEITVGAGNALRKYQIHFYPLIDSREKAVGRVMMIRAMGQASIPQPRFASERTIPLSEANAFRGEPSQSVEEARVGRSSLWESSKRFYAVPINESLNIPPNINPAWHKTRERIFTSITRIAASVGTFGFLLSLIPSERVTAVDFIYGLFCLLLWILGVYRQLKYHLRVFGFLFIIYCFGFVETFNFGFSAESFTFFASFAIITAILTAWREALYSLGLATATITVFAVAIGSGSFLPPQLLPNESLSPLSVQAGLASAVVFLTCAGALQTSVVMLLESLNAAWQKEVQALNLLQQERDLLEQRVEERTHDLAQSQKMLKENEIRFRQIVENANDIIYRTDAYGRFVYINPITLHLMGLETESEALGRHFTEFIIPEWRHRTKRFYEKQFLSGVERTYFEFPATIYTGETIWVGQNVQLIKESGQGVGFQAVARDITQIKKAEETFIFSRDQALNANQLKSQLLSRVSHELRTPLGTILGYAELLQIKAFGGLSEKQNGAVNNIIESTNYLTNIINDLLDEAQIEANSMSLNEEYFSPQEFIEKIQSHIAVLANKKGLTCNASISDELPIELYGDVKRLQQIVINLAGNAVKFTRSGGVEINLTRPQPAFWAIEVKDTGVGIAEADRQHIFEPFRQASNSITRENRGSGLGLAITKQLIELMGGTIALESTLGQGSVFTVLLPIKNAPGE
ncbi:MAG: PAS domain S-box protein [Anaerolineales bacterium]|nr:PAS domain S-box protein [Anaerolineales bacterium]